MNASFVSYTPHHHAALELIKTEFPAAFHNGKPLGDRQLITVPNCERKTLAQSKAVNYLRSNGLGHMFGAR